MAGNETTERFWDDVLRTMRKQAEETPEQTADRFERVMRRLLDLPEDEIQSIRASMLVQVH